MILILGANCPLSLNLEGSNNLEFTFIYEHPALETVTDTPVSLSGGLYVEV